MDTARATVATSTTTEYKTNRIAVKQLGPVWRWLDRSMNLRVAPEGRYLVPLR